MVHTIVVPLDGSEFAEQALEPARRLAQRVHGELQLVRVFEPTIPSIFTSGVPVLDPRLDAEQRGEARAYLDGIATRERERAGVPLQTALLDGSVVETLAEHVATVHGALVVMTTHGRGGLARAWIGSVADGIARRSSVPVIAIRLGDDVPRAPATGAFRRVLLPMAGAHFGLEIIDRAVDVAGTTDVEYILLHVLSPIPVMPPSEPVIPITALDLDADEGAALEFLEELASPMRARGLHVSTRVVNNVNRARAILDYVDAEDIDLIAMATHGERGARRLLLGSVADKVLRSSQVPVMVVRPPDTSDPRSAASAGTTSSASR